MDMVYKIISSSLFPQFDPTDFDKPTSEILEIAMQFINDRFDDLDVPIESKTVKTLELVKGLIGQAILNLIESTRSRSSSMTSTGSLGDRLAVRDKEDYLYTYPWVNRDSGVDGGRSNAVWERGNSFREWAEHPHRRLPTPKSALNCWEGVAVLLYMYHALSKQDITTAYKAATYEGDGPAVNLLFGLEDETCTHQLEAKALQDFVKTGDVLIFHSNRGSELGHVALVIDNFERLWVASHWSLPKEKMIKITPNRIFTASRDSAFEQFDTDAHKESDRLAQKQHDISVLLDIDSINPTTIAELKKDYMVDRSYDDVMGLMQQAKEKREAEYEDYSGFEIQKYERQVIQRLYAQAQQLMASFESTIEKYKDNETVLGIVYDFIDSFDQSSEFYSPLYILEYLADDTVTVSTKFRSFFDE